MSLTRKEFFRQGLFSLGKTALEIVDTMKVGTANTYANLPDSADPPVARPDMVAEAFNERCLARSCGCIACVERCEPEAIMVVPGQGIRIDESRCTGCSMCEYVCPVTPKAVILSPRKS